jgi:transposase
MTILSSSDQRTFVSWVLWLIVFLSLLLMPGRMVRTVGAAPAPGEIWQSAYDPVGWLGPNLRLRWYAAWRRVWQWLKGWERWLVLAARLWACRNLAQVIQALTRQQMVRYLGALPVLVALLERLQVRGTINHYCPTRSPVDHGAVALVLVLNRLMTPRPLYKMVDWLATTLIAEHLGIPRDKFNDDRLGRTLDDLAAHLPAIWSDLQRQVLLRYKIDLSILFYDLTALVMSGQYPESALVDYGFAHNTPSDDPKLKLGLVASQDGGLPLLFQPWSGRTADKATVQTNLHNLRAFLHQHGWSAAQVLVVGDCANLNSELAFAYQEANLRYLAGLAKLEKVHRQLVLAPQARDFERLPLAEGYFGVPCEVSFTHNGRSLTHRGLVVRSDPMRQALRQERQKHLRELLLALEQIQGKLGQKRYRSEQEVCQRVATQVKRSPVGQLVGVQVYTTPEGKLSLAWWIDANALQAAQRGDGRFLLVTNDFSLSYGNMLALYRKKDVAEKRFEVCKQDLKVRPLHVHSDERIQAMLLINLIALLAYSLLERQAQQHGLCLTARRMIEQLSTLQVQAIEAWDGSRAWSFQQTLPGQRQLLTTLLQALDEKPRSPLPSGPLTRNLLLEGLPLQVDNFLTPPQMSSR